MQIITGKVVDGKIQLDVPLEEVSTVAVLATEEGTFRLSGAEEQELAAALAAVNDGGFVDGRELLAQLKAQKF